MTDVLAVIGIGAGILIGGLISGLQLWSRLERERFQRNGGLPEVRVAYSTEKLAASTERILGHLSEQIESTSVRDTKDMREAVKDDGSLTRSDIQDLRTSAEQQDAVQRGIEIGEERERRRITRGG